MRPPGSQGQQHKRVAVSENNDPGLSAACVVRSGSSSPDRSTHEGGDKGASFVIGRRRLATTRLALPPSGPRRPDEGRHRLGTDPKPCGPAGRLDVRDIGPGGRTQGKPGGDLHGKGNGLLHGNDTTRPPSRRQVQQGPLAPARHQHGIDEAQARHHGPVTVGPGLAG